MRAHHATHDHATRDACTVVCPLCQEKFQQRSVLESHLVEKHNVTQEGMQRLMLIVDQIPVAPATVAKTTTPPPLSSSPSATVDMTDAEKQESMENEVLKLAEEGKQRFSSVSSHTGMLGYVYVIQYSDITDGRFLAIFIN